MVELIEVRLTDKDRAEIQERGHIRLYGFSWIDPDFPGLGRSVLPESFAALFCNDEDRPKSPQFYEPVPEDDDLGYIQGHWIYSDAGRRELHQAHYLRYCSEHWTISDGDYLHIFSSRESCLGFLHSRRDFHRYVARAPGGGLKPIQINITLPE